MKLIFTILFTTVFALIAFGQGEVPAPASASDGNVIINGATVHVGNGQVLQNHSILMAYGVIVKVYPNANDKADKIIDATGKHVYPGIIATGSTLGLVEVNAVRATRDYQEVGNINPNVRSIIAYNTDSKIIPTVRSNGVLMAQIAPQGGTMPGTSSIVQLDAWNWEDAAYVLDNGLHLNWPGMFRQTGWWAEPGAIEVSDSYNKKVAEIEQFFTEAKAYCEIDNPKEKNLKYEACRSLFNKKSKLFVNVNYVRAIKDAIESISKLDVEMVIVGGSDTYLLTDLLKEKNIPVVIKETHNLPNYEDDDIDQPFTLPKVLHENNILFSIAIWGGWDGSWGQRNLPYQAGTAAAYGLDKEVALSAITGNAAKILGIDKTTGTLEVGKDATLFISTGDVLDMRTSNVETAFIQGREINLIDKQKLLYQKFQTKYKEQGLID